jgi:hypothetical protein
VQCAPIHSAALARNYVHGSVWRFATDYKRFLALHEAGHVNGPLADVYLDRPRKGLRFSIHPKVRNDRRRYWLAAVMIQKEFRRGDLRRWVACPRTLCTP